MKRRLILFLGMLLVLQFAGCGSREPAVARVGKEKITAKEFKDTFIQRFRGEDNARLRSYQDREKLVREMAINLAKYQEAVARGFDKKPDVDKSVKASAQRKALDLLYEDKVMKVVASDAAAREFYDKSAMEVKARHILIKTMPQDTSKGDTVKAFARIDSIRKAITGGLSFKAAAKMFSEDATSAVDSGDVGWFGWGRMVDEFQRAAWAANLNQIVGPVRTPYGYHLIVVEEKRPTQDRRPFEEMKDKIKAQIREAESAKLGEIARQYLDKLHERRGLKINDANSDLFRKKLADPSAAKSQTVGPLFTEEQQKLVIASYKGGEVKISDLVEKVGANAHRVDWTLPQTMTDLVNSIVEPKLLEWDVEEQGYLKKAANDPDVIGEKRRGLIGQLEKEEITSKVNPSEQEERTFYQNHLANYIQPEMRTIREIFIKEDTLKADRVWKRAKKGESFIKLAKQFNEKESTQPDTGRIGPFEEKRFGLIGKTAFKLQNPGDVSEMVALGKNYSFIQLLDITPSRTKSYEEAQSDVKRQCRQAMTEDKQKALEESLLKKYKLDIDQKALTAVWPLEAKKPEDKIAREP